MLFWNKQKNLKKKNGLALFAEQGFVLIHYQQKQWHLKQNKQGTTNASKTNPAKMQTNKRYLKQI